MQAAATTVNCVHFKGPWAKRDGVQICRCEIDANRHRGCTADENSFGLQSCASCPLKESRVVPAFWRVDIIITSHNYGRFLDDALDSIGLQDQSIVGQVIVVDDASDADDQTRQICERRGVKYLRTELRSPHLARGAGLAECSSPLVWFLDADNKGQEGYLLEAVKLFAANQRLAIVYPNLQSFGTHTKRMEQPSTFDGERLERMNFIDTGSVWLTEAIRQTFLFDDKLAGLEDWRLARQVMRMGRWEAARNPVPLSYRRHDNNLLASGYYGRDYFEWAGLSDEVVTTFTTFSGRVQSTPDLWERRKAWLREQTWPRIRLVISNTSHQPLPQGWDDGLPAMAGLSVYEHPVGFPGLEDRNRWGDEKVESDVSTAVAAIYNRMWQETQTEFVLVLEDDVFPERADAIELLMRAVDPNVCAVTGQYRQRYYPYGVTYWPGIAEDGMPKLRHQAPDSGVSDIAGCGFGCVLLRRSQMASEVIVANSAVSKYYDPYIFDRMARKGLRARINFAVKCDHAGPKMPAPPMPADKLTIVLATIGKPTLRRALQSVVKQMGPYDEVWLVSDGPASAEVKSLWWQASPMGKLIELAEGPHNDWGHTPRNKVLPGVENGYVINFDDDDEIPDGALENVREAIRAGVGDLLLFQMRRNDGSIIPVGEVVESGNVGTPMFIFPAGIKLGKFAQQYDGDFYFISSTIEANLDRKLRWVPSVIIDIRPDNKPKPKPVAAPIDKRRQQQLRAYSCVHRGEVARIDLRPPCQGGPEPLFACDLHGECSLGRYCSQQTAQACSRCGDRSELIQLQGLAVLA